MHRRLKAMTPQDRLAEGLALCDFAFRMRLHRIAQQHPGLPRYQHIAIWTDETYRGTVPDRLLEGALAEIRRRGQAEAAASEPAV
jgi:hypothetical protein